MRVRGARENNLKSIDVDIPRDAIVAFTGISGSGKSSLAFGTLYAEAQRRYFESVAPYARRLLQQVGAPQVTEITELPPAVALQQRRGAPSSRSTVGTITTLSNLARMLYSRAGTYPEGAPLLEAESFSPNTAAGACPRCEGLGVIHDVTAELMVPDPSLSIRERAIAAWPGAWQGANLRSVVSGLGIDIDAPWHTLDEGDRHWLLFTDEQPKVFVEPEPGRIDHSYQGRFLSGRRHILRVLSESESPRMRERALGFTESMICADCRGAGLRPEALAVTVAGHSIAALNALTLTGAAALLRPLVEHPGGAAGAQGSVHAPAQAPVPAPAQATDARARIATDLLARMDVLIDMGLGYLSLDRSSTTLSGGEVQRLRIATQLRSGLFGVVYVLDEPSAGLHPADVEPLLEVLERLKASGNSLFVVEHDMDVVARADWVIDIGPGAGEGGGHVLYSGPAAGLQEVAGSRTSDHLFGRARPGDCERREPGGWLTLTGANRNNLRDVTAAFPMRTLTAVTGVSGAGKSTLVAGVLADAVRAHLERSTRGGGEPGAPSGNVSGAEQVTRVVQVDQRPIGRTPRSTLATYTGMFDVVRKLFAETDAARSRGWSPGRFSFNVTEGRCPTCQGEGFVEVELMFLPGTYGPCPTCGGDRYAPDTLEIRWRGKTIAEVLELSVDAAAEFFADVAGVSRSLETLRQVGLGYLRLGQPATTLSGGEAQRIKIATELQRPRRDHTLYLLDEPTASLHPADVALLMRQLQRLVGSGNTVVIVEHDLDAILAADWMIDLGPGGGERGGAVIATGTPQELARERAGVTGKYLERRRRGLQSPAEPSP